MISAERQCRNQSMSGRAGAYRPRARGEADYETGQQTDKEIRAKRISYIIKSRICLRNCMYDGVQRSEMEDGIRRKTSLQWMYKSPPAGWMRHRRRPGA